MDSFAGYEEVRMGRVQYRKIEELESVHPRTQNLPFLKRHPYRDEKEYRVIYGSPSSSEQVRHFGILLGSIRRIVLSPQLHAGLADGLRNLLRRIEGCGHLSITRTTLLDNPRWQSLVGEIDDP